MIIAFDAELLYDEETHIKYYGNIEMVTNTKMMNDENKVIVWSEKGISHAKRIGSLVGLPGNIEYTNRTDTNRTDEVDLEYIKGDKIKKGKVAIRAY